MFMRGCVLPGRICDIQPQSSFRPCIQFLVLPDTDEAKPPSSSVQGTEESAAFWPASLREPGNVHLMISFIIERAHLHIGALNNNICRASEIRRKCLNDGKRVMLACDDQPKGL